MLNGSPITTLGTIKCRVGGKTVNTLRDTGANICGIRNKYVEPNQFTGEMLDVECFGGITHKWPSAFIDIDTPYYSGKVLAVVFKRGPYDLILGNVKDIQNPSEEQISEWLTAKQINIVQTRSRVTKELTLEEQAVVANDGSTVQRSDRPTEMLEKHDSIWNPTEFQREQTNDPSLVKIFKLASKNSKTASKTTEHAFAFKNNTLIRKFKDGRKEYTQLVAPRKYRPVILRQAHDLSLAGHMGRRKTKQRIQTSFYWPGMDKDISKYIQSCSRCMNTERTPQPAPLQKTDLACRPFEKIAVDIIGPLNPTSHRGNRFILTIVDLATRWPETFPLKHTTSEDIANCLLQFFSRTGFPDTILSDRGPQFTSDITREISRLLGIKQNFTSPYHPQSNGVCERLNGTIKSMISKIPKKDSANWDLFLPCLLFAYRELPHSATGFSPFELVYGANPKGPMNIMKSMLLDEKLNSDIKNTYEKVVDLREQIIRSCEIAKASLEEAGELYRLRINNGRNLRKFRVGDQVRVLLPSKENKLQLAWRGPYTILKQITKVDYEVDVNGKSKIFHVNILSSFNIRPPDLEETEHTASISCAMIHEDNDEDEREIHTLPSDNESYKDVKLGPMTPEIQNEITNILLEYQDTLSAAPGKTSSIEHDIKLTSEKPIKLQPYSLPLHYRDKVQDEINDLINAGIIETSDSPYAAPIVLAKKKNGEVRLCINYIQLNKITIPDAEPMPNQEELFVKISQAKIFSKFDLSRGYWQIPIKESAKKYTAFITPFGLYHWNFMSFGLINAPATFNRLMRKVLNNNPDTVAYLDDICLFSNNWADHIKGLKSLLESLKLHGLTARPSKIEIGMEKITFLGHVISHQLVKPVGETVQRILDLQIPKTKKDVRSLLGLCNYYRKFIPNFASLLHPITELTKTKGPGVGKTIHWTKECDDALNSVKTCFAQQPILRLPDINKSFTLTTDASSRGIGACLMQEVDGHLHPVLYVSRKLSPAEKNYAIIEKECLAIVWAVTKLSKYLLGAPFTLMTDHSPLVALDRKKLSNAKLTRWSLILQDFIFNIVYIPGVQNKIADTLSRS